jgi:hypothetical protein
MVIRHGPRNSSNEKPGIPFSLFVSAGVNHWNTTCICQQPTPSDDRVNKLAREIYCRFVKIHHGCVPHKSLRTMARINQEKMTEGWTDRQIKDFFAEQYGDRVLAEPP